MWIQARTRLDAMNILAVREASEQLDCRVAMVAVRGASGNGKVGDRLAGHFVLTEMSFKQ